MATTEDGQLIEAARAGDQQAFGRLFDEWFDRVHDLSRRIVRDPEIAAEVAQDTFLSAWTRLASLQDVDAFGGWLLRIARNTSLNRLARERRSVAFDDQTLTTITDRDPDEVDHLERLDRAAQIDLVWQAAQALGPRDLSILDLHLRHGLGPAELADELGTNRNNANQLLHQLRNRLGLSVRAFVLWRAGRPRCADLRSELVDDGRGAFDKRTVKVINRHADRCLECGQSREEFVSPAALFSAAPVIAASLLLKSKAAAALEQSGIPMAGSAFAPNAPAPPGPSSTAPSAPSESPSTSGPSSRSGPSGSGPDSVSTAAYIIGGPDGRAENPALPEGVEPAPPVAPDPRRRQRLLAVLSVLFLLLFATIAWVAFGNPEPGPTLEPATTSFTVDSSSTTATSPSTTTATTLAPTTSAATVPTTSVAPPRSTPTAPRRTTPPTSPPPTTTVPTTTTNVDTGPTTTQDPAVTTIPGLPPSIP